MGARSLRCGWSRVLTNDGSGKAKVTVPVAAATNESNGPKVGEAVVFAGALFASVGHEAPPICRRTSCTTSTSVPLSYSLPTRWITRLVPPPPTSQTANKSVGSSMPYLTMKMNSPESDSQHVVVQS